MEKRCSNCAYCNEKADGPHCGSCYIGAGHTNWEEWVPPLKPKFKVGDKVIFQDCFGHAPLYGTIIEITNNHWEPYRIKEKDKPDIWDVSEYEITGVWDDTVISAPNYLSDYFRYFPTFSFPTLSDAILRIDTDSIKVKKEDNMNNRPRDHKFVRTEIKNKRIKEVIFNGPATIIKWEPSMSQFCNNKKGDKTVSVCGEGDIYDKEKGFLLAVIKEFVDNQSYDNILRMMDSFNEERK